MDNMLIHAKQFKLQGKLNTNLKNHKSLNRPVRANFRVELLGEGFIGLGFLKVLHC